MDNKSNFCIFHFKIELCGLLKQQREEHSIVQDVGQLGTMKMSTAMMGQTTYQKVVQAAEMQQCITPNHLCTRYLIKDVDLVENLQNKVGRIVCIVEAACERKAVIYFTDRPNVFLIIGRFRNLILLSFILNNLTRSFVARLFLSRKFSQTWYPLLTKGSQCVGYSRGGQKHSSYYNKNITLLTD